MHTFPFTCLCLIASLVSSVQALSRTTRALNRRTDTCAANTIPDDCCTRKPIPPDFPWSTDIEECPLDRFRCCTETKEVLSATAPNTEINCGRDAVRTSTITVTVEACGVKYPTQQCLHITYNNVPGTTYEEFHLQIDDDRIRSSTPGQFTFTEYCDFPSSSDHTTIDCWVPESAIIDTFEYPTVTSLCEKTIYVAAHSAISDGNTCWVGDLPISQRPNNWAKYFSIKFSCDKECIHACCCPTTPPPLDIHCDVGTAFAKSTCPLSEDGTCPLNPDLGCQRWGWYFPDFTTGFTAPLILGQTTPVGTVTVTVDATGVHWSFDPTVPYGLIEAHVDLHCEAIPPKNPPDDNPCAPGQYTYNSGCLSLDAGQSWTDDAPVCASGHYWAIFHAKVFEAGTTACPAIVCPLPDDEE